MKNIHILPTDKPSRLHLWTDENGSRLELCDLEYSHTRNTQNIYITNDEEIKEGDWCIYNSGEVIHYLVKINTDNLKKIILTTDPELIKDGVQKIDDDFLEWFVKNPSCEKVETEVISTWWNSGVKNDYYKIIIPKEEIKQVCENCKIEISKWGCGCAKPKEEPKFGDSFENLANVMSMANFMFGVKEEPKQEYQSDCICDTECRGFVNVKCKKLEEAAERLAYDSTEENKEFPSMKRFNEGDKWQARKYNSSKLKELLDEVTQLEMEQTKNKMQLAARIEDLMKAKGWNKSQFADKVGKHPSEITKWLSGTQNFTVDVLTEIASKLGVELAALL